MGFYEYNISRRTNRGKLPNVDECIGERPQSEHDRTLRSFRNMDAMAGDQIDSLGMQMIPTSLESSMRVGDELTVIDYGEQFYAK